MTTTTDRLFALWVELGWHRRTRLVASLGTGELAELIVVAERRLPGDPLGVVSELVRELERRAGVRS